MSIDWEHVFGYQILTCCTRLRPLDGTQLPQDETRLRQACRGHDFGVISTPHGTSNSDHGRRRRERLQVDRKPWKARLATKLGDEYPQTVTHHKRLGQPSGSSRTRHETRRRTRYLGCGGFGSVYLQECESVDVEWDDSECEGDGDDEGIVGTLRAVKQIAKPIWTSAGQDGLARELHGMLFFSKPEVRDYRLSCT